MTKTVFRVYPDGAVIALFPQISASVSGGPKGQHDTDVSDLCESYMHIGQHSGATPELVVRRTRLATPEEYQDLKMELETIGYKIQPAKRMTYKDFLIRAEQYRQETTT